MNVYWTCASGEFELHRYPKGQHDKALQAWDSADELAIEHCHTWPDDTQVLILNDLFGALSLGLHAFAPTVITDSEVSKRAIEQNSQVNAVPVPAVLDSLSPWPKINSIVIKLTKNLGYLEHQLIQIANLDYEVQVVATGKTTLVTSSVLKLFEQYLSDVHTSLARKKSRLIFARHLGNGKEHTSPYPVRVEWPEKQLTLQAHANVFCKDQLDIGGRFLADNLPAFEDGQKIVDLGCGNGLLGLCALKQATESKIKIDMRFYDESYMAVESARLNVTNNFPESLEQCHFVQDDCLTSLDSNSVDLVLCNPPFHQQNTLTEHIAEQMFSDASRVLTRGGVLYVVANRHLPYQKALKKHFGGFKLAAQNSKFVIYSCRKLRNLN